ncbi:hypothetical protein LS70_006290 [Helicobacter sp. MIT 11-5569]|uniref:hypothetical protein n=1 Tax=Helicobacter sp. MIT 11-5569 TaxID=1548151 RepID=UPI00051F8BE8|nr:hypothetical protein [Helicobacter sp. MIT 11-5569]TLD82897.1 hypothetical protein LS70_006290 [Helicobacter sp. MIT 11-5569]
MRYFALILAECLLIADPFYYGNIELGELRLFAIMHKKANINGRWVELDTNFVHANVNFKLLSIQDSCVIVENLESKTKQNLCKSKPKFIKEY